MNDSFATILQRARLACLLAGLFRAMGRALLALLLLALLAALADLSFVLDEGCRELLRATVLTLTAFYALLETAFALRALRRLPQELDRLNADPRHSVSCALSLPIAGKGLSAWLAQSARDEAAQAVRRARRHHPMLRRAAGGLLAMLLTAGALGGLYAAWPEATLTLAHRLALPQDDVPPYSSIRFTLTPAAPRVHYGEDLPLAVSLSGEGAEAVEGVTLLLRVEGLPEQSLPAFRNRQGQWVRMLEKVVTPCRIAFATEDGRARTPFVPVELNYSPRILSGKALVSPLAYTGLPEREVVLGGSEIRVPDGSRVSFTLASDRELAGGYGIFKPAGEGEARRVEAQAGGKGMRLELTLREPGTLSLQVIDREGREADSPVQTRLAVLPDSPPEVTITAPEDQSYVVAGEKLSLAVEATDDYGLARFDLFKALRPYRQHPVSVRQGQGAKQRHEQVVDTAALGLQPGDVLELRAEVGDANPFRFNIISSPTSQVYVISTPQYAEMLRQELFYEDFMARYEALDEARRDALRSLEAAEAAQTPEERRAAMEQVAAAHARAAELAEQIAEDFPVFAADSDLSALASEIAQQFRANEQQAKGDVPADDTAWREQLAAMRERLDASANELAEQTAQAQLVELSMKVQEAQQRFAELAERQRGLVELFTRYIREKGLAAANSSGQLEGLGAEQAAIMQDYIAWEEGLSPLLAELRRHDELQNQWQYIFQLRTACEQAGVAGLMEQAVDEAARQRSADAQSYARRALEGMEQLLQKEASQQEAEKAMQSDCNCQGGMCSNAAQTLREMLNAMKNKQGQGSGREGTGMAGQRGGRFYGPNRSRHQRGSKGKAGAPASRGRADEGSGHKPGSSDTQQGSEQEGSPGTGRTLPGGMNSQLQLEHVPPAYRDAVRSYFSH